MEKNDITPKEPWRSRQAVKPTTATEETGSFILEEGKGEKKKESKRRETGQEIEKSKESRVVKQYYRARTQKPQNLGQHLTLLLSTARITGNVTQRD